MPSLAHGQVADAVWSLRRDAWQRYLAPGPAVSNAGRERMRQAQAGSPRTMHVTPYRRRAWQDGSCAPGLAHSAAPVPRQAGPGWL